MRRAACRMETEEWQKAIDDYESAKEVEPDNVNQAGPALRQAKIELKKSKRKDLYKVLGVTKHATDHEIKKGYKKSAMQWHPDRHSSGTEEEKAAAELKFKEIGEAFEVLSDPQKKAQFDQGMDLEEINGGGGGGGGGGHHGIDPDELFRMFNGGMGGGGFPGGMGGPAASEEGAAYCI